MSLLIRFISCQNISQNAGNSVHEKAARAWASRQISNPGYSPNIISLADATMNFRPKTSNKIYTILTF